jgi:DNA-binding CsgD family transcriptional regulator
VSLTDRERQVLALLAHGYTQRAIARQLGTNDRQIRRITKPLFARLGAANAAQAIAIASYQQAIGCLANVARRTGSPAARWAAEYLTADPDRLALVPTRRETPA